jgi:heat shock protein HslJ
MTLVSHLSFDDQEMTAPPVFAPGEGFEKAWRVRNVGTCTWNNSYTLVFAGGNDPAARMGGQPLVITGEVAPGAETDLALNLAAPLVSGEYQGFWSMRASNGLLFGDRLAVGIRVEAAPTPTPLPTSTPSPNISFTADPTQLMAGECTTFSWDVRNAANVFFYAVGEPSQLSPVAASGTQQECPPVTTTFELRVILADGSAEVRQQRIDVLPPPVNAPQIVLFSVTPDFQIAVGQCVQIAWQVIGSVNEVRLLRNEAPLWDSAPLSGSFGDCPPPGSMVYALEVSGPGGNARAQREVVAVFPSPTPVSTPISPPVFTPTPTGSLPPVINSFSVQPGRIPAGQCVTLNWSVGGGANRVQILRDGRLLLDNGQLTGVATDCLVNSGSYIYRIEARNQANLSTFQQAAVTVDQPGANNLLQGSWRLVSLNGQTLSGAMLITAVFGDGGNLSGNAGCNNYTTSYQTSGIAIAIGLLSLGQNVCLNPPEIMLLEGQYLSTLQSSNIFVVSNEQLTLSGSGELIFVRN